MGGDDLAGEGGLRGARPAQRLDLPDPSLNLSGRSGPRGLERTRSGPTSCAGDLGGVYPYPTCRQGLDRGVWAHWGRRTAQCPRVPDREEEVERAIVGDPSLVVVRQLPEPRLDLLVVPELFVQPDEPLGGGAVLLGADGLDRGEGEGGERPHHHGRLWEEGPTEPDLGHVPGELPGHPDPRGLLGHLLHGLKGLVGVPDPLEPSDPAADTAVEGRYPAARDTRWRSSENLRALLYPGRGGLHRDTQACEPGGDILPAHLPGSL
jgi:hypothetical protein